MLHNNITHQVSHVPGKVKSTLAVSIAMAAFGLSISATAALNPGSRLLMGPQSYGCNFDLGTYPDCLAGSYPAKNYFAMDVDGNGSHETTERVAISPGTDGGITLGVTQALGGIDAAWSFFNASGWHYTPLAGVAVATDNGAGSVTLDMSGWTVNWNGGDIDMGQGADAVSACDNTCEGGDVFVLDYNATVPSGQFDGVFYAFHIEGTISAPGAIPVAADDSAVTIVNNSVIIDVLANDPPPADPIIEGSVAIDSQATNGTANDNTDDTVTYTPDADYQGDDSFVYTVANANGTSLTATSDPAGAEGEQGIVTIDVQTNQRPVANDDLGSDGVESSTSALDNAINSPDGGIIVNVLANDIDTNNDPGLPGGIDLATVEVINQPAIGTCSPNPDGTITYTQTPPSVSVTTTCTYQVSDIDNSATPALTSDPAIVDIVISGILSDWDANLDPGIIPILQFDPGVPDPSGNTAEKPESGTYFSMAVSAATTIYTTMTPGTDGGMIIGHDQIGGISHTGAPTGDEIAVMDLGWNFFGNTGMTYTSNGGIVGNSEGTLEFKGTPGVGDPPGQGRYIITWNGIPAIDLGGSSSFPQDLGFATINCDTVTPVDPANTELCADGNFFELDYKAHVPPGDPSGFGGVPYGLRMTGKVRFMDGALQTSDGVFEIEDRLPQAGVTPDTAMLIQCAGDCFDFKVTGVNDPSVSVVLPLAGGIPKSYVDGSGDTVMPVLRVFRDNAWSNFITNADDPASNDTVKSAAMIDGGEFGLHCPSPGHAAYGALTAGHQCVEVTIEDDGPNDKAPNDPGTVIDPAGIGLPAGAAFVDRRTSGSSGCVLSANPHDLSRSGAWWLLAGFISWLGWQRRNTRLH